MVCRAFGEQPLANGGPVAIPCFHNTSGRKSATVIVGDDGWPVFHCNKCDNDAAWLRRFGEHVISRGVPGDTLRPTMRPGSGSGSPTAKSTGTTAARGAAKPPSERQVEQWFTDAWNSGRLAELAAERGISEETLACAEVGWNSGHFVLPVRDLITGRLVDYDVYRKPKGATKKTPCHRKGAKGGRLYAPGGFDPSRPILFDEGQWDALAADELGCNVVGWTGGAGNTPSSADLEPLRGTNVTVLYDADEAGRKGALKMASALAGVGCSVRVADLDPDREHPDDDHYDVRDFLIKGGTADDLADIIQAAETVVVEPSTWGEMNLSRCLTDDEDEADAPSVALREDGVFLLYRGKVNAFNSESEAGKTWAALAACVAEVNAGRHVLFLDFEDSDRTFVKRLRELGLSDEQINKQCHYVRPDEPLDEEGRAALFAVVERYAPTVAVVDGITEVMGLHGWSIKDNDDAAKLMKEIARPLARTGAAVLLLDHVTKARDARRFAIGAQHKLSGVDGIVYLLENVVPFGRGRTGRSRMFINKDRPGYVRPEALSARYAGDFVLVGKEDGAVLAQFEVPDPTYTVGKEDRGSKAPNARDRVLAALTVGGQWTVANIVKWCAEGGKGPELKVRTVQDALKELTDAKRARKVSGSEGKEGVWEVIRVGGADDDDDA